MQKKAYPIGKPDFPERKTKTLQFFLFRNEGHRTLKSSLGKVREKSGIIKFHTKRNIQFRHLELYLWKWRLFDNYFCFFCSFDENFLSFQIYWVFSILCDPSMWCHFLDISCVRQFWGPLEAMLSWIMSSARELRASNLKHKDCCFHHLQTLFMEGNIVRQLDSRFLSFWLASWGSPKLKTFAVNVGRQRRKIYWQNFANVVAIRRPPLFF